MARVDEDEVREHRIHTEIVVDAYHDVERAMGWYCYLHDELRFPFKARCIAKRYTSPLAEGEEVRAEAMAPEEECRHEMFVEVCWQGRRLGVPLSQLEAVDVDRETREAIGDWHYWVGRGYEF